MFHVEVNLIYICYLVNLVFLMRPSGDQLDVPCGPRGETFAHPIVHSNQFIFRISPFFFEREPIIFMLFLQEVLEVNAMQHYR